MAVRMRDLTPKKQDPIKWLRYAALAILIRIQRTLSVWRSWQERIVPHALYLFYPLVLLALYGGLLARQFTAAYDSDQVAGIVTLQNWRLGDGSTAWLPSDNFFLKVPFYLLVRALLPNSPVAMLAIAVLLAGVAYGLFFLAHRLLIGRPLQRTDFLPLLLLASLGSSFYYILREPNARNIEIGVSFVSMAVAVRSLANHWPFPTGARGRLLIGGGPRRSASLCSTT